MERIQKAQIKMGWGVKHDNLRDLQNPGPQCSVDLDQPVTSRPLSQTCSMNNFRWLQAKITVKSTRF